MKLILASAVLLSTGLMANGHADEITSQPTNSTAHTMMESVIDIFKTVENQAHIAEKAATKQVTEKTREEKLVETANRYLGVPYVYGGTTPEGFDCSGFTSYVYREALGQEIGRTTWAQMDAGQQVAVADAKVGDVLVFFGGNHVGIYLGNGQFIHAPQPGDVVNVSSLSIMPADFALSL